MNDVNDPGPLYEGTLNPPPSGGSNKLRIATLGCTINATLPQSFTDADPVAWGGIGGAPDQVIYARASGPDVEFRWQFGDIAVSGSGCLWAVGPYAFVDSVDPIASNGIFARDLQLTP